MPTEKEARRKERFFGGISLTPHKNTAELQTVAMPSPQTVTVLMKQGQNSLCTPCVKQGDTVLVGTKIGDNEDLACPPVYSSVSGTVTGISLYTLPSGETIDAVIIESDGQMTPEQALAPVTVESAEDLIKAIRDASIDVCLPATEGIDTLIINAADGEPYVTAAYRRCVETAEEIIEGTLLIKKILGIKNAVICVENDKQRAIDLLVKVITDKCDADNSIELVRLGTKYPQTAEKLLFFAATGKKMPASKDLTDVGCICLDVTSVLELYKYVTTGMPTVSATVTVDGNAVATPKNVIVPIGASVADVIEFCGGYKASVRKIICGGPMTGVAVPSDSAPILKQYNAVLAFDRKQTEKHVEAACIRCGRCASVCPMRLRPFEIESALKKGKIKKLSALYTKYCIECGCCSYSCPSKRRLVEMMRMAKAELKVGKEE